MKIDRFAAAPVLQGVCRKRMTMVCFFFALGAVFGLVMQRLVPTEEHEQLRAYILQYARSFAATESQSAPVASVACVYFRYPLLAIFCACSALGILLIPLLAVLCSASLSFSLGCFASALGRGGVYLAFAAFGLRCLVVLPCTFYLFAWAWERAGRSWRSGKAAKGRREKNAGASNGIFSLLLCFAALLIGAALEIRFLPEIFARVLEAVQ